MPRWRMMPGRGTSSLTPVTMPIFLRMALMQIPIRTKESPASTTNCPGSLKTSAPAPRHDLNVLMFQVVFSVVMPVLITTSVTVGAMVVIAMVGIMGSGSSFYLRC